MRTRALSWVMLLGTWVGLLGCKSDDDPQPISRADAPARLASILCDSLAPCCQAKSFAFDVAGCRTQATSELESDFVDYDPSRVDYDANAMGECLQVFAEQVECGQLSLDEDDVAACQRVFVGKAAIGQPCTSSIECQRAEGQAVTCAVQSEASDGVCTLLNYVQLAHGKAGDPCQLTCPSSDGCGLVLEPDEPDAAQRAACYRTDDLQCGEGGTCQALVPVGQTCRSSASCAGGAYCDFGSGTCSARKPDGAACSFDDDECQSDDCSEAGVCGGRSTTITAEDCTLPIDF